MSRNRRRACQFDLSVNSLEDSLLSTELNSEHHQAFSNDSLNTTSHISCKGNASVLDLNERIVSSPTKNAKGYAARDLNTKHIAERDYNWSKENENPQCLVKHVQPVINEDATSKLKKKSFAKVHVTKSSSRDTNFNIEQSNNKPCTGPMRVEGDNFADSQKVNFETPTHSDISKTEVDYPKFESMLCFLDNQLNQIEEASKPQQLYKRLSNNFNVSPTNFTERLLTIIEESVIHDDANVSESGVNLSRLTTEFKKMCKFIEDETIPEWPPSPLSTPPYHSQTKTNTNSVSSAESTKLSHEKSTSMSPMKSPFKKVHSSYKDHLKSRKMQHRLSKGLLSSSMDNLMNVSLNQTYNDSFERLEAQCNKLFKNTLESPKPLYKALSLPVLKSMESIHKICEQQMASLNTTNAMIAENEHLNEESSVSKNEKASKKQSIVVSCQDSFSNDSTLRGMEQEQEYLLGENKDEETLKADSPKINCEELETTIMQDLAEKRKRCLDTVKLLIDINAEPQKGQPQSPTSNEEAKFVNTLATCQEYYRHLKKQKPFFNFLRSELSPMEVSDEPSVKGSSTPMSKACNPKKSPCLQKRMKGTSKNECRQRKFFVSPVTSPTNKSYLSPRTKSASKEAGPNSNKQKRKFFPTPGKNAPTTPCRRKQLLYPNMQNALKKTPECILKSPNAKGLYRLNYNTVVSPVGMYIRGTDTQLMKNVQGKTDNFLLKSPKQKDQKSPSFLSVQSQKQKASRTSPGINSTPKSSMHTGHHIARCHTPTTTEKLYALPKVTYKLPAQTHTVKDNELKDTRQHMRTLLQSTHSKVVIHHRGRIHSEKKDEANIRTSDADVINHNSGDESIHIVQAASKSNYFQNRLYI